MAGTKDGGKAAAATNKGKYGDNFYAKIGSLGGKKSNPDAPKGFAYLKANGMLDKVVEAGRSGGLKSRRYKKDV